MAIPVLPIMVLGIGMLVLRGRRRSSRKGDSQGPEPTPTEPTAVVFVPPPSRGDAPPGPSGQPGMPCDAPDGEGAWDELGHCKTFWIDGVTDEAIARMAREEWEARGRPSFSDMCLAVPDPAGGEFAPPKDNPRLAEIAAAVLGRYYGVSSGLFPPTEALQGHEASSPYWVHQAWANAFAVVRKELCGQ